MRQDDTPRIAEIILLSLEAIRHPVVPSTLICGATSVLCSVRLRILDLDHQLERVWWFPELLLGCKIGAHTAELSGFQHNRLHPRGTRVRSSCATISNPFKIIGDLSLLVLEHDGRLHDGRLYA